jgi:hypothetical protein
MACRGSGVRIPSDPPDRKKPLMTNVIGGFFFATAATRSDGIFTSAASFSGEHIVELGYRRASLRAGNNLEWSPES